MPVISPSNLKKILPPVGRLLGLDLGTKTIGLALSDPGRVIATPMATLTRQKFTQDAAALLREADAHQIAALIIGLPVNMDGSEGPRCQSTRQFAENLLGLRDLPIAFWDERLSTQAVTRTMLDADMSRKRRAEIVDKLAASYILQGALDYLTRA